MKITYHTQSSILPTSLAPFLHKSKASLARLARTMNPPRNQHAGPPGADNPDSRAGSSGEAEKSRTIGGSSATTERHLLNHPDKLLSPVERHNYVARRIGENLPPISSPDRLTQRRAIAHREDFLYAVGEDAILNEAERQRRDNYHLNDIILEKLDKRAQAGIPYRPVSSPADNSFAYPAPTTPLPATPPVQSSSNTTREPRTPKSHISFSEQVLADPTSHRALDFSIELVAATPPASSRSTSSTKEPSSWTSERELAVGRKRSDKYTSTSISISACPPDLPPSDSSSHSVRPRNAPGSTQKPVQATRPNQDSQEALHPAQNPRRRRASQAIQPPPTTVPRSPTQQRHPYLPRQDLSAHQQPPPDVPVKSSRPGPKPHHSPTLEHFITFPPPCHH